MRHSIRERSHIRLTVALAVVVGLLVSGCGSSGSNGTLHQDDPPVRPPRPPADAVADTLVQAAGGAQEDASGLIENSAVLGEPYAAGVQSSAGAAEVRHGFAPPIPPGWPSGLAQVPAGAPAQPLN